MLTLSLNVSVTGLFLSVARRKVGITVPPGTSEFWLVGTSTEEALVDFTLPQLGFIKFPKLKISSVSWIVFLVLPTFIKRSCISLISTWFLHGAWAPLRSAYCPL